MANNPIHLTILRRGDTHIVDLAETHAIIPRSETRVDGAFLEEISQEIKRITNQVGPELRKAAEKIEPELRRNPHVVRELKNLGSLIFSHLLPQAARDKLRNTQGGNLYLRLDDQLVHIPWELAFDGQHFLGMKFRVGRQVITHHRGTQLAATRPASQNLKVLIVSDPSETLKNVSQESEQLCEVLDKIRGLEVRLLGGKGVKRIPLLAALRESDVVHFAGHSQFDEKNPENSGWLLHDGLLSASEISKLDHAPLLVFSNSCHAGATNSWQSDYLYEGEAFGLGSAFLLAGVGNYVGTFCVVHDGESRFLAVEFYRRLAHGQSIGQALLEARLATAEEMGLERLTWASYMLYGDPNFSPLAPQPPLAISLTPRRKSQAGSEVKPQVTPVSADVRTKKRTSYLSAPLFGWIAAGLFTVILGGFLLFMLLKPRETTEVPPNVSPPQMAAENKKNNSPPVAMSGNAPEAVPSPSAVSKTKPQQDLGDIEVQVDHLQVVPEHKQVAVFLRLINKTSKDLAIVRGDSDPFVTDNKGWSYHFKDSSGIRSGQYHQQNWTYVPPSGEHTLSMRFQDYSSQPKQDSLYSVSAEVVVTSREDLQRTPAGRRPEAARTVNISIHEIRPN